MHTVGDLFLAVGGQGKMAELLGIKYSTASEMKRRESIPVRYWPDLVDACKDRGIRGINYDILVSIHAPSVPPPSLPEVTVAA